MQKQPLERNTPAIFRVGGWGAPRAAKTLQSRRVSETILFPALTNDTVAAPRGMPADLIDDVTYGSYNL